MKELLEAGVHFGHRTRRWNPKMKQYIYAGRNGIYIIDLHQTLQLFEDAREFIQDVAGKNKSVLFVGTKKQAQDAIEEAAQRCRMFYVNQRWLGGMLTNFRTIRSRVDRMVEIEKRDESGELAKLPKKEAAKLREEHDKLARNLNGIRDMGELPGAVFIVDLKKEHIALAEARKLKIPVLAIVDTNCDPDEVDFVIPGNDDAIRAIKLILTRIAEAIVEVKQIEWQGATVGPAPEAATEDAEPAPEQPGEEAAPAAGVQWDEVPPALEDEGGEPGEEVVDIG
jgi:small subunit ribosomal protein S2